MKRFIFLCAVLCISFFAFAQKGPQLRNRDADTLVIGLHAGVQNLDASLSTAASEGQVMMSLFEPLIGMNASDNSFYPALAMEVPTKANGLISADGATYTFNLRKGVQFHDGTEMKADDVVNSFDRLLHHPKSLPKGLFTAILRVKKIDDYKITVTFGRLKDKAVAFSNWAEREAAMVPAPYGPALNMLSHYNATIQSKAAIEKAGADYGTKVLMGTGPYKFVSWPNPLEVNLEAFGDWWGKANTLAFKKITYRVISDQSQVNNTLQTGEIDMSFNFLKMGASALEKSGIQLVKKRGVTFYYFLFNMMSPLVGQLNADGTLDNDGTYNDQDSTYLRKAIFYAFNPMPSIRQVDLLNGYASPLSQMLHPGLVGYVNGSPKGTPLEDFNPNSGYYNRAKAREYFNKISPEFKKNLTPESVIIAMANDSARVKMANNIKDAVKATLGVDLIKVVPVVLTQTFEMGRTGKGYDIQISGWMATGMDPDFATQLFRGETVGGGANRAWYINAIVDENVLKARYTADVAERTELYKKAMFQLMADKAFYPMYNEDCVFAVHPRIGNAKDAIMESKFIVVKDLKKAF